LEELAVMNIGRACFRGVALLALLPLLAHHRDASGGDITTGEDAVILDETWDIDIHSPEEARVRYSCRTQVLTARGAEEYRAVGIG